MIERCKFCGKTHETDEFEVFGMNIKVCPEVPPQWDFVSVDWSKFADTLQSNPDCAMLVEKELRSRQDLYMYGTPTSEACNPTAVQHAPLSDSGIDGYNLEYSVPMWCTNITKDGVVTFDTEPPKPLAPSLLKAFRDRFGPEAGENARAILERIMPREIELD